MVRPVKMSPGPALDRPLPADSVEKVASASGLSSAPAVEVVPAETVLVGR